MQRTVPHPPQLVVTLEACRSAESDPYGIYDMAGNTGWVSVGTDHDTAAFAVAATRRWWQAPGAGTTTRPPPVR